MDQLPSQGKWSSQSLFVSASFCFVSCAFLPARIGHHFSRVILYFFRTAGDDNSARVRHLLQTAQQRLLKDWMDETRIDQASSKLRAGGEAHAKSVGILMQWANAPVHLLKMFARVFFMMCACEESPRASERASRRVTHATCAYLPSLPPFPGPCLHRSTQQSRGREKVCPGDPAVARMRGVLGQAERGHQDCASGVCVCVCVCVCVSECVSVCARARRLSQL